jgi:hypothetical protein
VGEIGFSYDRFLYGLMWWEVRSIIRGYNNRHHPGWEQARLIAYNAAHAFGSKHQPPPVTQWLPFPWEKAVTDLPSDDEVNEIREAIRQEERNKSKP